MTEGSGFFFLGCLIGAIAVSLVVWFAREYQRTQCAKDHDVFRCEAVTIFRPVEREVQR